MKKTLPEKKPVGRPPKLANGKRRNIFIDDASWSIAERIGHGSASDGIRIAIALAAIAESL